MLFRSGGWNQYNGLEIKTNPWHGPENRYSSMSIKLASYGAMIFKYIRPVEEDLVPETVEIDEDTLFRITPEAIEEAVKARETQVELKRVVVKRTIAAKFGLEDPHDKK